MTNEAASDLGYTFRDRIVVLENEVRHMRDDLRQEITQRTEANSERKVDAANLNSKIDQLEAKLNTKIDTAIITLSTSIDKALLASSDKLDKITRLVYIGVGIGVGLNFILAVIMVILVAFKK